MPDINLVDHSGGEILRLGNVKVRILEDGSRTDNRISAAEFVIPAGTAQTPPHVHRMHDETFLITKGAIRFTAAGRDYDVHAGGYVVVPVGVAHKFSNPFAEEAIFFNTFTPAYYIKYFRDLASLAAQGGLTPARILDVMAKYATEPA